MQWFLHAYLSSPFLTIIEQLLGRGMHSGVLGEEGRIFRHTFFEERDHGLATFSFEVLWLKSWIFAGVLD